MVGQLNLAVGYRPKRPPLGHVPQRRETVLRWLSGLLRNEDFIPSNFCRAGKMPALGPPRRLSHVI